MNQRWTFVVGLLLLLLGSVAGLYLAVSVVHARVEGVFGTVVSDAPSNRFDRFRCPLFLRKRETAEVAVRLANPTGDELDYQVRVEGYGLGIRSPEGEQRVAIPGGEAVELTWVVEAVESGNQAIAVQAISSRDAALPGPFHTWPTSFRQGKGILVLGGPLTGSLLVLSSLTCVAAGAVVLVPRLRARVGGRMGRDQDGKSGSNRSRLLLAVTVGIGLGIANLVLAWSMQDLFVLFPAVVVFVLGPLYIALVLPVYFLLGYPAMSQPLLTASNALVWAVAGAAATYLKSRAADSAQARSEGLPAAWRAFVHSVLAISLGGVLAHTALLVIRFDTAVGEVMLLALVMGLLLALEDWAWTRKLPSRSRVGWWAAALAVDVVAVLVVLGLGEVTVGVIPGGSGSRFPPLPLWPNIVVGAMGLAAGCGSGLVLGQTREMDQGWKRRWLVIRGLGWLVGFYAAILLVETQWGMGY